MKLSVQPPVQPGDGVSVSSHSPGQHKSRGPVRLTHPGTGRLHAALMMTKSSRQHKAFQAKADDVVGSENKATGLRSSYQPCTGRVLRAVPVNCLGATATLKTEKPILLLRAHNKRKTSQPGFMVSLVSDPLELDLLLKTSTGLLWNLHRQSQGST